MLAIDEQSGLGREDVSDGAVDAAARWILAEEAKPPGERWYNLDAAGAGGHAPNSGHGDDSNDRILPIVSPDRDAHFSSI